MPRPNESITVLLPGAVIMISVSIDADWRRFETAWLNFSKCEKRTRRLRCCCEQTGEIPISDGRQDPSKG